MRTRLGERRLALKQRHDALPNLVSAVRSQLGFEQQVLTEVTRLRAEYSPDASMRDQAALSEATSGAVRSLFGVVEGYPELRSAESVMALQQEIERLETLMACRRELFNEQVYAYHAAIDQLPGVLLRPLFGWRHSVLLGLGGRAADAEHGDDMSRVRPTATGRDGVCPARPGARVTPHANAGLCGCSPPLPRRAGSVACPGVEG
jgi:LemA protein